MKNTRGCMKPLAVLVFLLDAMVLVAACIVVYVSLSRHALQARANFAPPIVVVREPASGVSVSAGSHLTVSSTSTGGRPIASAELWVDGELKETQKSDRPEGVSPFYVDFDLLVPSEGPHMLFVRAIDTAGLIGQSPPVSLIGVAKPAETFQAVQVLAGETLDEIAAAYGIQPKILQDLNQGLGNSPPAGSMVKVPAPPDEPEPTAPPVVPGVSAPVVIPNVPMMQIASERSAGLLPIGPFIPEPFAGNASPPTPPAAPSALQAEVKGCKVTLRWFDNAADEEQYYVYVVSVTFHGFAVPFAYLKPSPATGSAWYEFQPTGGGSFSIWVEAANSYGSQPSNTAWIAIPPGCPSTTAPRLRFTLLDMSIAGSYDKAYCYVSVEGSTERRLPYWESEFITIQGGKGILQGQSFYTTNTFPIPDDGSVEASGECWGWWGDTLNKLGSFNSKFPKETWDGTRQTIDGSGGSFQFGVSIKGETEISPVAVTEATDPTLPVPYDVSEEPAPLVLGLDQLIPCTLPPACCDGSGMVIPRKQMDLRFS